MSGCFVNYQSQDNVCEMMFLKWSALCLSEISITGCCLVGLIVQTGPGWMEMLDCRKVITSFFFRFQQILHISQFVYINKCKTYHTSSGSMTEQVYQIWEKFHQSAVSVCLGGLGTSQQTPVIIGGRQSMEQNNGFQNFSECGTWSTATICHSTPVFLLLGSCVIDHKFLVS